MPRCALTHSCGHVEILTILGPRRTREIRVAQMRARPCPDCLRKAHNAASAALSDALALPALTGSSKQVEWAVTLRLEAVQAFDAGSVLRYLRQHPAFHAAGIIHREDEAAYKAVKSLFAGWVNRHTEARFWIDSRVFDMHELCAAGIAADLLREPAPLSH